MALGLHLVKSLDCDDPQVVRVAMLVCLICSAATLDKQTIDNKILGSVAQLLTQGINFKTEQGKQRIENMALAIDGNFCSPYHLELVVHCIARVRQNYKGA